MVAAARREYPGIAFEVADLRKWRPAEPFDAVFSNATLHWILDADAAAKTLAAYAAVLERHGFAVTFATLFERPTPLAGGFDGLGAWYREFCSHMFAAVAPERRESAIARAGELARGRFVDGTWVADYVRLRVRAVKRASVR